MTKENSGEKMKLTSGCIININNNLLLLKYPDGKYCIPEGYVKDDELLKVACINAIKEKTSFNVLPNAMFGVYDAIDRKYPERTIGAYYITHIDILQEHAEKLVQEFNTDNKDKLGYELVLLSMIDIANQEYMYDHKIIMNNYFRILMLGSQTFNKKDEQK
jgi:ADP-ribose pyrophosphatase YjhB (NUDIX family)